jgi:carboxyl-terminal processing protease
MTNKKIQVWFPLLFSLTLIFGMIVGYRMRDNMPGRSFFSYEKQTPIQKILNLINNKYVDSVNMNKLNDSAIQFVLSQLDPHSAFIPADKLQFVNDELAGSFTGIGIEFNIIHDTINVLNVIPSGPSFSAGIQIGDQFLKINDSTIAGKKITEDKARQIFRGEMNTSVTITILRNGNQKKITVTRNQVSVNSISAAYIIKDSIGYIKLDKFTEISYREFMQSLEALQKKGMNRLILDLRGNGGGILDQAIEIADEFLDDEKLITYTEGVHYPRKEYRCKRPGLFEKGPLIVLADEGSASASEVLLGALQDWNRATIIGRRTFGKGLVQEQYNLNDGSALRLTIARYYTPLGRCIQRSYAKGTQSYYNDFYQRYSDGELTNRDSIKNDTSNAFITPNGKKVYGGGGITPDIFVPIDNITKLDTQFYIKGTLQTFSLKYYLQHKQSLSAFKNPEDFAGHFSFSNKDWKDFIDMSMADSIHISNISDRNKTTIIHTIKSIIARSLWQDEGMCEILNTDDSIIQKALEVLEKK